MNDIREQIRHLRFPAILSSERRRHRDQAADTMENMLAVVEAAKYIKFKVHSHAADQQFPAHYELTTEEYIPLWNALAALDQEQE